MKEKTILIVGGGLLQVPIIRTALSMNLFTVVADMNEEAPGMKLAHRSIIMSTKDIEGMVRESKRFAEKHPVHGVVTAGTDASMTVAAVASALGLPGIRYVDAEAATNKVKMRERLKKFGVPIPGFASVWSIQDARDALSYLAFPLVIKPADNMGARGVIKVNDREELQAAFKHAKQYSPSGEMILEEYMPGPELSVDAISYNGRIQITGVADRIIEKEPYFIEIGHTMPSALSPGILAEVEDVMKRGMKALGITLGAGKGDIKVTPDGVKVGEIAARLSGGFMSAYTYPLSTGVDLNRAVIQIALGEDPGELKPGHHKVSIERALFAEPGKLLSIRGVEEAKKLPLVNEIFIHNQPGDIIKAPSNNIEKSGHVIITADTLEEAEKALKLVRETIEFVSDPLFSIDEKLIAKNARRRFGKETCWVCKICDGTDCASGVPGMGALGQMLSFQDNIKALREYSIQARYIRENIEPEAESSFLSQKLSFPLMAAPMTGAVTNMNGAMDEYEYSLTVLKASLTSGTLAWLGDGASPDKVYTMIDALKQVSGRGVLICKPRSDAGLLKERFQMAEEVQALALGMDIDAVKFKTMQAKAQATTMRTVKELSEIRKLTKLPFIVKGVMSTEDAKLAFEAGADAIVVSNHGGRVLDDMPGTARVLPYIREALGEHFPILVDGGVRSGMDVFKMLALGANQVLLGRPVAIYAVGGGEAGVRLLYQQYKREFIESMTMAGAKRPSEIRREMLFNKTGRVDGYGN
ncbi:MAG: alpha-hydroxy-acid oxidizing protein [Leptospiraceae bacterium]|nr:alpha-hydroxy-acid oxidizing protein [Leptospiraceae bacterium]MCP5500031.1 alpha-hydroxy-acid oxidizing protein [Leptospiraceae bacterium]